MNLNRGKQDKSNLLFTDDFEKIITKADMKTKEVELLLKKILQLDDELIYTKAIMSNRILDNNPHIRKSNSSIIKDIYKMQDYVKKKVINVMNKFYKDKFELFDDSFMNIMHLYIREMRSRGFNINVHGSIFLLDVIEIEKDIFIQFHVSYMDSIILLCNNEINKEIIERLLEYEEPLYKTIEELIGSTTLKKYVQGI